MLYIARQSQATPWLTSEPKQNLEHRISFTHGIVAICRNFVQFRSRTGLLQSEPQQHNAARSQAQSVMSSAYASALEHGRESTRAATNQLLDNIDAFARKNATELSSMVTGGLASWLGARGGGAGTSAGGSATNGAAAGGSSAPRVRQPGGTQGGAGDAGSQRSAAAGGGAEGTGAVGSAAASWWYGQAAAMGSSVLGAMTKGASEAGAHVLACAVSSWFSGLINLGQSNDLSRTAWV